MSVFKRWKLPPLLDLVMRQKRLEAYRSAVVGAASGRVLEVGVGSGLNLPYYSDRVEHLYGLDPSQRLLAIARRRASAATMPIEFKLGSAMAIPLGDSSVDTIVMTWTLCSIPDPAAALREMRRVLKPDGQLLFVEHGLAPEPGVQRWQHWLTPVWRLRGGCHLNRKMDSLIEAAGFGLSQLETGYAPGPRAMSFMYRGCACGDHATP